MPYLSCNSPWQVQSGGFLNCSTETNYAQTIEQALNLATCSIAFEVQVDFINCQGTLINETNQVSSTSYSFQLDNFTYASGFINEPSNFTSSLSTISEPPISTSETYVLNKDLMTVLFAESMFIFGFGILMGGIIGLIRKTAHK